MRIPFTWAAERPGGEPGRGSPSRSHFFRSGWCALRLLVGARVALLDDLLVDLARVAAPIVDEALEYVASVGSQSAHPADARFPPGSGFEGRVLLDGVALYPEGASDGGLVHPVVGQD